MNQTKNECNKMIEECLKDIDAEEWEGGGAIWASSIGSSREFLEKLKEKIQTEELTVEEKLKLVQIYERM